jgi:hypothetical protein
MTEEKKNPNHVLSKQDGKSEQPSLLPAEVEISVGDSYIISKVNIKKIELPEGIEDAAWILPKARAVAPPVVTSLEKEVAKPIVDVWCVDDSLEAKKAKKAKQSSPTSSKAPNE